MGINNNDDDDSVVPLSEQTLRPRDTALRQQRIPAWYPMLHPWWVIFTFYLIGAIFIPTGYKMQALSNDVVELVYEYDSFDGVNEKCGITKANENKSCTLTFEIPKDMKPPILVYYQINNFYQNHRRYLKSVDIYQLNGAITQQPLYAKYCNPLNFLGGIKINPCGLIANTMFNDVISLVGSTISREPALEMLETGIAWQSDVEYKFKQPIGFNHDVCPGACDASCCDGDEWSCTTPYLNPKDGLCYRYFYPEDDTTQYLYETYPMVVSPLEGVTNEHFIVWMRIATLSTFRKLYGWFDRPLFAGEVLEFQVLNNFEVDSFHGKKSLVLSTTNIFGGRNPFLGPFFYIVGFVSVGAATFFALKQKIRPRKIGDPKYLQLKED